MKFNSEVPINVTPQSSETTITPTNDHTLVTNFKAEKYSKKDHSSLALLLTDFLHDFHSDFKSALKDWNQNSSSLPALLELSPNSLKLLLMMGFLNLNDLRSNTTDQIPVALEKYFKKYIDRDFHNPAELERWRSSAIERYETLASIRSLSVHGNFSVLVRSFLNAGNYQVGFYAVDPRQLVSDFLMSFSAPHKMIIKLSDVEQKLRYPEVLNHLLMRRELFDFLKACEHGVYKIHESYPEFQSNFCKLFIEAMISQPNLQYDSKLAGLIGRYAHTASNVEELKQNISKELELSSNNNTLNYLKVLALNHYAKNSVNNLIAGTLLGGACAFIYNNLIPEQQLPGFADYQTFSAIGAMTFFSINTYAFVKNCIKHLPTRLYGFELVRKLSK
jgi:hypothetical protein